MAYKEIGITTTVPAEVLLAAGYQPLDLNNIFIGDPHPEHLVAVAEKAGFPLNCCTWIKGIYGVCMERGISRVLCVTSGDCSNSTMLMEVLKFKGLEVVPFAYPDRPDKVAMRRALTGLAAEMGTTLRAAVKVRRELQPARALAAELDRLTWREGLVSGAENHLWLVSASDFNQDAARYQSELRELIAACLQREPCPPDFLRLAYIGVPAVFGADLYKYLETKRARVVFNEVQRQFAIPEAGNSLADQYTRYTYPYSIYGRLRDIEHELKARRIDGVIHYVQAFCHRGIGDIIFRGSLDLPVLTLEGNNEFFLSQHVKTRVEAFLDMLRRGGVKCVRKFSEVRQ